MLLIVSKSAASSSSSFGLQDHRGLAYLSNLQIQWMPFGNTSHQWKLKWLGWAPLTMQLTTGHLTLHQCVVGSYQSNKYAPQFTGRYLSSRLIEPTIHMVGSNAVQIVKLLHILCSLAVKLSWRQKDNNLDCHVIQVLHLMAIGSGSEPLRMILFCEG